MTIIQLRCPACGFEDEIIRSATLAQKVIQDHGPFCPRCGTLMQPVPARIGKSSTPEGVKKSKTRGGEQGCGRS